VTAPSAPAPEAAAAQVVRLLAQQRRTLAVAESLTGGLVLAILISVPGASQVIRGGVVAYATDLKASLLGVDPALLARVGAVDPDVAAAMAVGVRNRLGADYGLATTGVAGPDPQDGTAVGTVFLGWCGPGYPEGIGWQAYVGEPTATREEIRRTTVSEALDVLADRIGY
jgi:nicotinamide-nucleotide amidase